MLVVIFQLLTQKRNPKHNFDHRKIICNGRTLASTEGGLVGHYMFKDFCKRQLPQKKNETFSEKKMPRTENPYIHQNKADRERQMLPAFSHMQELGA